MRRHVTVLLATVFTFAFATPGSHARGAEPVAIEPGVVQLFVDDELIQSSHALRRTLHVPRKDDGGNVPVIELKEAFTEHPGTLEANGSIVFDRKLNRYVMFALAFRPTSTAWDRTQLYRFTSDDGLEWVSGDHGAPDPVFPRAPDDLLDVASGARASNIDLFSCFYDERDERHPYKGWLWFANWGDRREGAYFVRSRDGKTWERGPLVVPNATRRFDHAGTTLHGPSDVSTIHPDRVTGRFLAALKFYAPQPIGPKNYLRSRAFLFVDDPARPIDLARLDRVALIPAAELAGGDRPHDEYYGSVAWRYGPLWLGELKVWHGGGDYPYSAAGAAFSKLAVSRDGLAWHKVPFDNEQGQPEVFIPNGPLGGNDGRNDGGYMTMFSQGPLRLGEELVLYYGCSSWGKNHAAGTRVTGGGIFRARMRPDGFVSCDAGTVTTKPLLFGGATGVTLNAVGPVSVELLDAGGAVLASHVVRGDSVRHEVRFDGRPLGDLTGGRPVRFRFKLDHAGARLFSFTVN